MPLFTIAEAATTAPATGEAVVADPAAGEAGHEAGTTAEGGHKGAFPPMDTATFPSQIFWLAVFFGLLYLLMSRVALPRLSAILEARSGKIEGDLVKAQALKDETEKAVETYEKALAAARSKAQSIAAETRAAMTAEMDAESAAVEKTLSTKVTAAETAIAAAKTKALADVGDVAAETAAEIVAKLTGISVTKTAASKAITDLKG